MGLSPFRRSCSVNSGCSSAPQLPAPNPTRFRIIQAVQMGTYVVAKVLYPDCTNYEGMKIMVFSNTTVSALRRLKVLDPHFCRGTGPIARFEPCPGGFDRAKQFVAMLNGFK